jgi:hypothetical protein
VQYPIERRLSRINAWSTDLQNVQLCGPLSRLLSLGQGGRSQGQGSSRINQMPASPSLVIKDTRWNPVALDNFLQVAGTRVKSLRETGLNDLFVCTSIRSLQMYAYLSYAISNEQS